MKRFFLAILLLLCLSFPSSATWYYSKVETASCADSSCAGFLTCQNFEGTGYDNSEIWEEISPCVGCTMDEDYTVNPGRGLQSLRMIPGADDPAVAWYPHASVSEVYVHFMFYFTAAPSLNNSDIFSSTDAGITQLVAVLMDTDRAIKISWLGVGVSSKTAPLSLNTWYHIWFYLKTGTGSNAEYWLKVSTDRFEPGSPDISGTNGTWTLDRASEYPSTEHGTGQDQRYDQILSKTTPIGDVCP